MISVQINITTQDIVNEGGFGECISRLEEALKNVKSVMLTSVQPAIHDDYFRVWLTVDGEINIKDGKEVSYIHFLKTLNTSPALKSSRGGKCSCPLSTLMISGCNCGSTNAKS